MSDTIPNPQQPPVSLEQFIQVLQALQQVKRHRTAAPTKTPRSFLDQFEFYDDGVNRRLYVYLNKTWRYVALT